MFKVALGIDNWAFEHTELAEMICFSDHHTKAAQCAIPNFQSNQPKFSARREINFKEASESSLILIPVLLWAEELQLCHEAVLS